MAATQEFPSSNMTQAHKAVLVIALLSPATLTQELGICRRLTSRHVPLLAPSGAIFPLEGHFLDDLSLALIHRTVQCCLFMGIYR